MRRKEEEGRKRSFLLHVLFFCSGLSGLVYQVVWVRSFGNVFGNTVYSASIVVALFMLGLGVGSYVIGAWADKRYARDHDSLLRAYAVIELLIAALGLAISLALPRLGALSAMASTYIVDGGGWLVLSQSSYVARAVVATVLLAPITILMGGTLTLLIRHRVRQDVEGRGHWKIALLYGVNTAGAAAGAFLTDFAFVPAAGIFATQMIAVALNVLAGAGALLLALSAKRHTEAPRHRERHSGSELGVSAPQRVVISEEHASRLILTAVALALCGFAAMGVEILWLRHFNLLLGGFRAVFSLLLTVMLIGIGAGSLLAGRAVRRFGRPVEMLMGVQAVFVLSVLSGLRSADLTDVMAHGQAVDAAWAGLTPFTRSMRELWFNLRPIVFEAGLPSLLMGCSFPLGNAVIQHAERLVSRRAGLLYFGNTAGAVCGSLAAGYLLLPRFGIQGSATMLMVTAGLAIVPLAFATHPRRFPITAVAVSALVVAAGLILWLRLPSGYMLQRSLAQAEDERLLTISEGVTEVIAVTEKPGRGRGLMTNGHPMSSTALLDQRYMRALAHIPLLAMDRPTRVLVIGFGAGNTTHAATLHPSVERVDVADLSRHVLQHAGYFRDVNGDILNDRRVSVYVNDGRQHLQMEPPATYDLITLEPPPIAHAGVAALYSRDFYALARTRLKPGGYLSQWLPAYQVPAETSLAMVRAFVEAFPQSVLLSGTQAELLLVGTTGASIETDPARLARALENAPAVQADLRRLDLGTPTEIVGTFVGSADTLASATREAAAVTDDRPLQEYGVHSSLGSARRGVPASLFDLASVRAWCPRCFDGENVAREAEGLDTYLAVMDEAYHAPVADILAARRAGPSGPASQPRRILGSAYLGTVAPDSPGVHYEVGSFLLERQQFAEAADEFEAALRSLPDSAAAHNNLGVALASMGRLPQATEHFRRATSLDPGFEEAQNNLAAAMQATAATAR